MTDYQNLQLLIFSVYSQQCSNGESTCFASSILRLGNHVVVRFFGNQRDCYGLYFRWFGELYLIDDSLNQIFRYLECILICPVLLLINERTSNVPSVFVLHQLDLSSAH